MTSINDLREELQKILASLDALGQASLDAYECGWVRRADPTFGGEIQITNETKWNTSDLRRIILAFRSYEGKMPGCGNDTHYVIKTFRPSESARDEFNSWWLHDKGFGPLMVKLGRNGDKKGENPTKIGIVPPDVKYFEGCDPIDVLGRSFERRAPDELIAQLFLRLQLARDSTNYRGRSNGSNVPSSVTSYEADSILEAATGKNLHWSSGVRCVLRWTNDVPDGSAHAAAMRVLRHTSRSISGVTFAAQEFSEALRNMKFQIDRLNKRGETFQRNVEICQTLLAEHDARVRIAFREKGFTPSDYEDWMFLPNVTEVSDE